MFIGAHGDAAAQRSRLIGGRKDGSRQQHPWPRARPAHGASNVDRPTQSGQARMA
jgi:hypothetical protein